MHFRIVELTIFSWTAPCAVLTIHFSLLPDDPRETVPPFAQLGREAVGAVVRSHPTRQSLPRIAVVDGHIR